MSIGILITSRNNYEFMEKFWTPRTTKVNNNQFKILNIDEDSFKEQKEYGKRICKENNIEYLDREKRGMLNNINSAISYFGDSVKYIVWFQTDCWPLQDDFFSRFNSIVESGKLDDFGVVGFNGLAENILEKHQYDVMVQQMKNGEMPIGVVARSPLEPGDQWYCGIKSRRIKKNVNQELFKHDCFSVEIAAWFGAAVNVQKYKEHVDTEHPFEWFHCWDDICFQFLNKNIHNVTIPSLYIDHRPDLKPEGGSPMRAVRLAYKGDDTYHSLVGFTEKEWKRVWGFEYDNRETFKKVRKQYKGTLIFDFYKHDPQNGPLRNFECLS